MTESTAPRQPSSQHEFAVVLRAVQIREQILIYLARHARGRRLNRNAISTANWCLGFLDGLQEFGPWADLFDPVDDLTRAGLGRSSIALPEPHADPLTIAQAYHYQFGRITARLEQPVRQASKASAA